MIDVNVCLNKLERINTLSFATVDKNGIPRDRIISTIYVEDQKIYFLTARGKDFYNELLEQKVVSILGYSRFKEQIRLVGKVKLADKQDEYRDKIFEKYPYLINVYPEKDNYSTKNILDIFVIEDAEIEYFHLGVYPIYRDYFTIGHYTITPKGFMITDQCIGCGTCHKLCPQQAIVEGTPYSIDSHHCLHCGNCFENCPVQAIERI